MGELKEWLIGIAVASVGCAILGMLEVKGAMKKSIQTVIALFFLCTILLPTGNVLKSIKAGSFSDYGQTVSVPQDLASRIAEQSCEAARESIRNLIQTVLIQNGIPFHTVTVRVDTDSDGVFRIENAEILLSSASKQTAEAVEELILQELGIAVRCAEGR